MKRKRKLNSGLLWTLVGCLLFWAVVLATCTGCTGAEQFGAGMATGAATMLETANNKIDDFNAAMDNLDAKTAAAESLADAFETKAGEIITKGKAAEERVKSIDFKDPNVWVALALAMFGGGTGVNMYKNRKKPE